MGVTHVVEPAELVERAQLQCVGDGHESVLVAVEQQVPQAVGHRHLLLSHTERDVEEEVVRHLRGGRL